jgi:hypothetical protein
MRYLYTPHLKRKYWTIQYNTYAHYTLDQEVPAPHKWDNKTEVEATGFTPAKKTSSSLDPEKTKISKKEQ